MSLGVRGRACVRLIPSTRGSLCNTPSVELWRVCDVARALVLRFVLAHNFFVFGGAQLAPTLVAAGSKTRVCARLIALKIAFNDASTRRLALVIAALCAPSGAQKKRDPVQFIQRAARGRATRRRPRAQYRLVHSIKLTAIQAANAREPRFTPGANLVSSALDLHGPSGQRGLASLRANAALERAPLALGAPPFATFCTPPRPTLCNPQL